LFHSAMPECEYKLQPNLDISPVTCHSIVHACRQRRCGLGAKLCCAWFSPEGCCGGRRGELCALPAEMRQALLAVLVKEPSLEEQVTALQGQVATLAAALYQYLQSQQTKSAAYGCYQ